MTKTIEEAARKFMETAPIEAVSPYYEEDMIEMFRGGTAHVLSLPLSQRLTDEEREMVRTMYNNSLYTSGYISACGFRLELVSIFGKELFGED